MKLFILASVLSFSVAAPAVSLQCSALFANPLIRGFTTDPVLLEEAARIAEQSRLRPEVDRIKGFNNTVILKAPSLEKTVRDETPYTVSLMGKNLVNEVDEIQEFAQMGFVIGDPHYGNLNSQPNVFRGKDVDRNRYGVVDLDEVTVGVFSLDLARSSIFLKARWGDLNKKFGKGFEKEFFSTYMQGLKQDRDVKPPAFIQKALDAKPEEIRAKVNKYALARTEANGKFSEKLLKKGELLEYSTKNMKPEFLEKMGFNRDKGDRKAFKAQILEKLTQAAQSELGENVKILDVAIPARDSGGSAAEERFLLSTEVLFAGETYRMILEFKENAEMAAWDAVIETPFESAAERYAMALKLTTDDGGPFLKIVEMGPKISFLMRPKGNLDVEFKSDQDFRELTLFNVYLQGLFHGGQGTPMSKDYVAAVAKNPTGFQKIVTAIAEKNLQKLSQVTGLKPPK